MTEVSAPRAKAEFTLQGKTEGVLKVLGWAFVISTGLYFSHKYALRYFHFSEASYGANWSRRGLIFAHVVPATIALLVGPWQLLSGLRRSHLRYHRVSGSVYLLAVAISSSASLYLGVAAAEPHWTVRLPLGALSVVWMITAGMAYVAIRNRRIEQHKEWMIRSYILTFAFVVTRLAREFPSLWQLGTEEQVATTVNWVCWTIPLFVAEVLFQKSKVQRPAPKGAV